MDDSAAEITLDITENGIDHRTTVGFIRSVTSLSEGLPETQNRNTGATDGDGIRVPEKRDTNDNTTVKMTPEKSLMDMMDLQPDVIRREQTMD